MPTQVWHRGHGFDHRTRRFLDVFFAPVPRIGFNLPSAGWATLLPAAGGKLPSIMRPPPTDFWQVGVAQAPIADWLNPAKCPVSHEEVCWLPDPGRWRYLADPFGIRRGDTTHVFVEAFDYRTKHSVIERHELGPELEWRGREVALARPYPLSYPFIVEDQGELFMVPESHRAAEISLYRASKFPGSWVLESVLLPGVAGSEPSLIRHGDHWWMFFTLAGSNARDQRELHVAFASKLTGPWRLHPQNPIIHDRSCTRPGGTPFVGAGGHVVLPVQDCSETYGGGLRFLSFPRLDPQRIYVKRHESRLSGMQISPSHCDGFHTLASCGDLTFVDAKRIAFSWERVALDWRRRWTRFAGRRPGYFDARAAQIDCQVTA